MYPGPSAAPRGHQPALPAALTPRRRQGSVPWRVYCAHDGRLLREVRDTQTTAQTRVRAYNLSCIQFGRSSFLQLILIIKKFGRHASLLWNPLS